MLCWRKYLESVCSWRYHYPDFTVLHIRKHCHYHICVFHGQTVLCLLKTQTWVLGILACTSGCFSSFGATKDSFPYWLPLGQCVALIMSLFKKETGKDKYTVLTVRLRQRILTYMSTVRRWWTDHLFGWHVLACSILWSSDSSSKIVEFRGLSPYAILLCARQIECKEGHTACPN